MDPHVAAGVDVDLVVAGAVVADGFDAAVCEGGDKVAVDAAGEGDGGERAVDYGHAGKSAVGAFGEEVGGGCCGGCDEVREGREGFVGVNGGLVVNGAEEEDLGFG